MTNRQQDRRIVPILFNTVEQSDLVTLDSTPFVVPVQARLPLLKQWWQAYKARDEQKAKNIVSVYVFHYHLRLLFPKEQGIFIAYPSSLVGLAKEEYYTSRRYRALARRTLERDLHRCRLCNGTNRLQVHHRNYSFWGNESLDELTTLCDHCHGLYHEHGPLLDNDGLFYVWSKPGRTFDKIYPLGYTNRMSLARVERDKYWK